MFLSKVLLAKDVGSRESLVTAVKEENRGKLLARSLFSVLRRAEAREGEQGEADRRVDIVEDRLEGWRDGHDGGCVEEVRSGETCISVELCDKILFSRFGGA